MAVLAAVGVPVVVVAVAVVIAAVAVGVVAGRVLAMRARGGSDVRPQ
jgi:hypothetical protein